VLVGWCRGSEKGKHGYILNMNRLVSLMDTQIGWGKGQTEEQIKCMDGVGNRGICVWLKSGCMFECPSRYSLEKESKK
jgi:hypothetical protein